jgi:hypothetical protein
VSIPSQFGPPPQQSGGGSGRAILAALLCVGVLSAVCCAGVCSGLFVLISRSPRTLEQVTASIEERVNPESSPRWIQDFVVSGQLSRSYTTALDAVAADKKVIDRLGEPIEPVGEADALFHREAEGELKGEETIGFTIKGPKGTAAVKVVAKTDPQRGVFHPDQIKVIFANVTEIEVPVPAEESIPEP